MFSRKKNFFGAAAICGLFLTTQSAMAQEQPTQNQADACNDFARAARLLADELDPAETQGPSVIMTHDEALLDAQQIFGPPPDPDEARFQDQRGEFRHAYYNELGRDYWARIYAHVYRMTDIDGRGVQPAGFTELVNAGATPDEAGEIIVSLGPPPDSILDPVGYQRWQDELRENVALYSGENFIGDIDIEAETKPDGAASAVDPVEILDNPAGCRPWEEHSVVIPPLINNLGTGVEN